MRKLVWVLALVATGACGDDDSGHGSDGGTGSVPPNAGFLFISGYDAISAMTPVVGGSVLATFSLQVTSSICTSQDVGPCIINTCPSTFPSPMYATAGTVTFTGLASPVTMMPQSDKTYPSYSTQQKLFSGGETINVQATGGDVPAFTFTYTTPAPATVTSPAKPSGTTPLVIDRTHDFSVAWTGGGSGDLDFVIGGPQGTGVSMNCTFAASAKSGTIPAAALGMLPAGSGTFSASSEILKSVDMGDWRIWGEAFFTAVWSDMSMFSATATLQ